MPLKERDMFTLIPVSQVMYKCTNRTRCNYKLHIMLWLQWRFSLQILSIADKHSFTAMVSPGFFPRGTHNFLTPSVLPHRVKIPAWLPSLFFWVSWVTQEWMEWQMGQNLSTVPLPCSCEQRFLSCVAVSVLRRVNKPITLQTSQAFAW